MSTRGMLSKLIFATTIAVHALAGQELTLQQRVAEGQRREAAGDFRGAEQIFGALLQEVEQQGANPRTLAAILDNLAMAKADLGEYVEAEHLGLRALSAARKSVGPARAAEARITWNLANLYTEAGRSTEAATFLRQFEAIAAQDVSSDPDVVAENLRDLGIIHLGRTSPVTALRLFDKALEVLDKQPTPNVTTIANTLIARAAAFGRLDRRTESLADLDRVAQIVREHPKLSPLVSIEMWVTYGVHHARANDRGQAERCMREASRLAEATYGPEHPILAMVLANYAGILRTWDKKQAKAAGERARLILAQNARVNPLGHTVDVSSFRVLGK